MSSHDTRIIETSRSAFMHRRLFATLMICVTLLAQLGAPIAGGPAAKDGVFANAIQCKAHPVVAAPAGDGIATQRDSNKKAPATHDHASCSLCQPGASDQPIETGALPVRKVDLHWRIVLAEPDAPIVGFSFNRSASARAPPSHV